MIWFVGLFVCFEGVGLFLFLGCVVWFGLGFVLLCFPPTLEITEWWGLDGTFGDHLGQATC